MIHYPSGWNSQVPSNLSHLPGGKQMMEGESGRVKQFILLPSSFIFCDDGDR
jgi:hypothetical protein